MRLSSPADDRFRYTVGLFYQSSANDIQERYLIDDLAGDLSVTGWPDTIWLTKQERDDDDKAIFADASYDFSEAWTLSAGIRFFESDNALKGFFGYSDGRLNWSLQRLPPAIELGSRILTFAAAVG